VSISIFLTLVAFAAKPSVGQIPPEKPKYEAAEIEPELELIDLTGTPQKLSSFRGRIIVLNFWATYCLPCREEMPILATIQNRYAAYGVQVIGASADFIDAKRDVVRFIKKVKVNFPVWLEAGMDDMQHFGLGPGLPGTAIIDRAGKVVWTSKKPVTEAQLKTRLDALLSESETRKTVGELLFF
jgi:thiol-disulfide isomerase/thioredoxin